MVSKFPGIFLELILVGADVITDAARADPLPLRLFSHDYLASFGTASVMLVVEAQDASADKLSFDEADSERPLSRSSSGATLPGLF